MRLAGRGAVAVLAAAALSACDNEIPTATGSDLFPGGQAPTTLLAEVTGTDLLLREEVLPGFGNPLRAPFLLVANDFDGAFDAHALARFTDIPDSVSYTRDGSARKSSRASGSAQRFLASRRAASAFART